MAATDRPANTTEDDSLTSLAATFQGLQAQITSQTMTPQEACDVLRISRRTYYRLVEEGWFTPVTFRGRALVPRAQVMAYMDELRAVAGIVGSLAASKRSPDSAA